MSCVLLAHGDETLTCIAIGSVGADHVPVVKGVAVVWCTVMLCVLALTCSGGSCCVHCSFSLICGWLL